MSLKKHFLSASFAVLCLPLGLNAAIDHPLKQGYVQKSDGTIQAITFEEVNGMAMVEGDIVLGASQKFSFKVQGLSHSVVIPSLGNHRWPQGVMPYEIDPNISESKRKTILEAMEHWQTHTSIRFVAIDDSNRAEYPDYVYFKPHAETVCSSEVGRVGGRQDINLAARCSTGSTIHEIGHALGLWHEQSRADRDQYIQIVWDNIKPEKQYNFNQHIKDGEDIGDYDYNSIMHYGPTAFSMNGEKTIIPVDPNANIGQRAGLSDKDIAAIEQMYSQSNNN